jgi:5-methylcytosine-specific restriction endonuclease McrA
MHKSQELNVSCDYCGQRFHKSRSKVRNSKSGRHFCCRVHKDRSQVVGGSIAPLHYGTGNNYRSKAMGAFEKRCEVCGYKDVPEVLVVHHIDRNRTNNELENLVILCPTCHEVKHFAAKDGRWSGSSD